MNILERIKKLEQKFKYFRIIDSEDIIAEDTGMGIALHLEDPFEDSEDDGDSYKGSFKVIQTAPNKIKIVDGFDETSSISGKVNVNYFPKSVAAPELTITENCFIYLECELVGSPAATGATAVIIKSNTELESEAGTYRELISRVEFTAPVAPETIGKISNFSRENVTRNILMSGGCG